MRRFITIFRKNEAGSNALEYGLIVALVSLAVVTGAGVAGGAMGKMFSDLGATIAGLTFPAI
jgi:pilus assembly protein Flp/PilA